MCLMKSGGEVKIEKFKVCKETGMECKRAANKVTA